MDMIQRDHSEPPLVPGGERPKTGLGSSSRRGNRGAARSCETRPKPVSHRSMAKVFNLGDRARLRERFYGATHTVLARL